MNAARTRSELGILADAVVVNVAGAGVGLEESIRRSFDVVFDADVVVVLVALADANDISRLLDRWIVRDFLDLGLVRRPSWTSHGRRCGRGPQTHA